MINDIQLSYEDREMLNSAKVEWLGTTACIGEIHPGDPAPEPEVSSWMLYDIRISDTGFLELVGKNGVRETVLWREPLRLGIRKVLDDMDARICRKGAAKHPWTRVLSEPSGNWYLDIPLCAGFTEEEVLWTLNRQAELHAPDAVEHFTRMADRWRKYIPKEARQ